MHFLISNLYKRRLIITINLTEPDKIFSCEPKHSLEPQTTLKDHICIYFINY